jgi:hypothetical protein
MSPAADGAAASKRQAELLKQEGNSFFKKDRISAAIDAYTGVINTATRARSPLLLFVRLERPPTRRAPFVSADS